MLLRLKESSAVARNLPKKFRILQRMIIQILRLSLVAVWEPAMR